MREAVSGNSAQTESSRGRARKATEQLRDANLERVFTLIRHTGPVSRSALTELTGLNRSTVGAVIAQLESDGWVSSLGGTADGPGRPSPVIEVASAPTVISINPEIDGIEVGLIGLNGEIREHLSVAADTSVSPTGYLERAADAIRHALDDRPELRAIGVGIAVPGLVDSNGVIQNAPHLGWRGFDIASLARSVFNLPVRVANDAACGALAERAWGAASGIGNFVFVNGGSSGIGASMFSSGTRLEGSAGFAGEWGHSVLDARGSAGRQTFEQLVSKRKMERLLGRQFVDRFEAGELSRPDVRAEVDEQLELLAVALRNIVNVCNPQRVVLGGYLAGLEHSRPGWLGSAVRDGALQPVGQGVDVVAAALGSEALLVGAAELCAERLPMTDGELL